MAERKMRKECRIERGSGAGDVGGVEVTVRTIFILLLRSMTSLFVYVFVFFKFVFVAIGLQKIAL